jgi:hypothetical protein
LASESVARRCRISVDKVVDERKNNWKKVEGGGEIHSNDVVNFN